MTPLITAIAAALPPSLVNIISVLFILIYMLVQHTNALIARNKFYNEFM